MSFKDTLEKLGPEFGVIDEELGQMHPVEQNVKGQLDRSAKLDEIDTITFGLETDDNKIVKVYVKADQADDFEKALAEKLGEIDDIEECLNLLSKDFEIVDVEWPEDPAEKTDEDEEAEDDDGSGSLNPKVYDNDKEKAAMSQNLKPKSENLNFGEQVTATLNESDGGSVEYRLVTPQQMMVYHAILELGIPQVALDHSPYRSQIIKAIKLKALELQHNATIKNALKTFVTRSINFDIVRKKEGEKLHGEVTHKLGSGETTETPNLENKLKDELRHRYTKKKKEDHKKETDKANDKHHPKDKKHVKEGLVVEEKIEWTFDKDDDDNLVISCPGLTLRLDTEQTEKAVKGITNKDVVVVRDEEDPTHKVVFSPRGPNALVKKVGTGAGFMMTAQDLDAMLSFIGKPDEKDEIEDTGEAGTKKSQGETP